jgi:hypothetical protein
VQANHSVGTRAVCLTTKLKEQVMSDSTVEKINELNGLPAMLSEFENKFISDNIAGSARGSCHLQRNKLPG